jgi:hypothetical protein
VGDVGLAQSANSTGKTARQPASAAFLHAFSELADPDLVEVIAAWPALPEAVRANIVANIRLAQGGTPTGDDEPGTIADAK